LLRQDIAWYDTRSQAEIVSNFAKDSMSFQLAVGEKISNVITILSMLIIGLGLSIYLGWILTLIMVGCLPIIGFCWYKNVSIRNNIRK
jgi:ATP-binding cassette, subfamily B (MDR/TAP), member 1